MESLIRERKVRGTYANESNVVMSAGAQPSREHPSNNRAFNNSLG